MRRRNLMDPSEIDKLNAKNFTEADLQAQSRILNEVFSTNFRSWEQSVVNGLVMADCLKLQLKRPLINRQEHELREMLGAGQYVTETVSEEGKTLGTLRSVTRPYWVYTTNDRLTKRATPLYFKAALGASAILFFMCVVWSFFHDSKYVILK